MLCFQNQERNWSIRCVEMNSHTNYTGWVVFVPPDGALDLWRLALQHHQQMCKRFERKNEKGHFRNRCRQSISSSLSWMENLIAKQQQLNRWDEHCRSEQHKHGDVMTKGLTWDPRFINELTNAATSQTIWTSKTDLTSGLSALQSLLG